MGGQSNALNWLFTFIILTKKAFLPFDCIFPSSKWLTCFPQKSKGYSMEQGSPFTNWTSA